MSNALVVVTIGTAALAAMAAMLALIARSHHTYCRYGREALLVAGALLTAYIPIRLLLFTHNISSELALQVNSLSAITAAVILGEVMVLRRKEREHNGKARSATKGA